MLSPGRKGQGRRGYLVGEVFVLLVLPPARHPGLLPWRPSAPGCKLLGQFVQPSVSVFLFHLPRNFPSFLLSCLTISLMDYGSSAFITTCGQKRGHILTLTSSGEACMVALKTQRLKVTTYYGLNVKRRSGSWWIVIP